MPDFFDHTPFPEPSAELAYAGSRLNRLAENRAPDSLERAINNPKTRVTVFNSGRAFINLGAGAPDPVFSIGDIAHFKPDLDHAVLLGFEDGIPFLAIPSQLDLETEKHTLPDTIKAIDYRSIALQGLLPQARMGDVALGAALLAWHASHRHCSKCGHKSDMADAGYKRVCSNCGTQHFPRTDPVVIMLAIDGNRCLMGRSQNWRTGAFSALAGFVEPGETIEDAVRRELFEEAGIHIGRVRYHASQPWPFPYTLMIGCFAEAKTTKITMDESELSDCRWFTRDEVLLALDDPEKAEFLAPTKIAIAHHVLAHWARWGR